MKIMTRLDLNGTFLVLGDGFTSPWFKTYLSTLGPAAVGCGIQGGEWDYEPTVELSKEHRRTLTMVLGAINNATSADFDVSLDILVWGFEHGQRGSDAPLDWCVLFMLFSPLVYSANC